MKRTSFFILFFCNIVFSFAQTEFKEPWDDTARAIIIDPYCHNPVDFEKLITDKRVTAIIHKASQGDSVDHKYVERKLLAKQYGLLWGSYHMGMSGDPIKQAEHYLSLIQNDSAELMALDLESLDSSKFMSLCNAEKFILHIYEKTKRYPLVYCNNTVLEEISKMYNRSSVFSKCGLWYARFVKEIPGFNINVWDSYTLWQFSCEINCKKTGECKYNVPGTLYDMDVNVYNGSVQELKQRWPEISYTINPVVANYNWLHGFDLDGDKINDDISFRFSGGAHCCYKMMITLSSDKKRQEFPFEMDGGYIRGIDNSQPEKFNISNIDSDPLPEITMRIESYNEESSQITEKWQKEYGIKTNYIIVQYEKGEMKVSDRGK